MANEKVDSAATLASLPVYITITNPHFFFFKSLFSRKESKSLNYYIRDSYVTAMYDSCKEVTNPSSNSLVMPTICGQWGEDCTPHRYVCSIHAVGQTQDSNRCFVSGLDCWTLWVKVSPMVDSRHLTFISSTSRMIMSSAKGSILSTLKLFLAPSPLA